MSESFQIIPDSYRYINWALFFLAACVNSIPAQAFTGVSPIVQRVYNISQLQSNSVGLLYSISYVFLLIPANYILDKKGLKLGTFVCQITMILGLLIRLLVKFNFYLFYVGTIFCSLGYCFMLSAANKFANIWFPRHQIFLVSTTCIFGLFTSDTIGAILSSIFITEKSTKDDIFNFFLWEGIALVFIHLLMAIFFRGTPKNIQNYASVSQRNPFKEDLKILLKNSNYLVLLLAMTFFFSCFELNMIFMPWIGKCYGYETRSNGIFIATCNILGCIGCIVIGKYGQKIAYRKKALICSISLIITQCLLWVSLELQSVMFSYACGGLFGFFGYPLLTTLTDFSTQTTFPVGEATASGILLFGGQIAGLVLVIIFSFFFTGQSLGMIRLLLGILILILAIGLFSVKFSKEILKRNEYQSIRQNQSSISASQSTVQQKLIIN